MRRGVVAALIASVLSVLTLLSYAARAPAAPGPDRPRGAIAAPPAPATGPVVLAGTGGFTWHEVSERDTPTLWALLDGAGTGTLSVKSVALSTCPVEGWLSLSAGERAGPAGAATPIRRVDEACAPLPTPQRARPQTGTAVTVGEPATVPGWASYVAAAHALRFGAEPGTLGQALSDVGVPAVAYGPGAAIALADRQGEVTAYVPVAWDQPGAQPGTVLPGLDANALSVIDLGTTGTPGSIGLAGIDRRLGLVLAAAGPRATVILAGLSDSDERAHLRPLAIARPGYPPGRLHSASTRLSDIAQAPDLTVTVLDLLGAPVPARLGGAALSVRATDPASAAQRRQALVDLDVAADAMTRLVAPVIYLVIGVQLLVYLGVWLASRRGRGDAARRRRNLRLLRAVSIAAAAVPVATFLANLLPWWRSQALFPALVAAILGWAGLIGAAAMAGPWRRHPLGPPAVIAAITWVVLALDVMTGSRLQISSVLGLQPLVGGRFYGMGNVAFAVFGSASLMLAMALAHLLRPSRLPAGAARTPPEARAGERTRDPWRARAAGAVGLVGVLTVVIDGSPAWGADGGGPPAYLPAWAYLLLATLGVALTWRRALLVGLGTATLFAVIAVADSLRPTDRQSHLGRFVDRIGSGEAWDIVVRKLQQNWELLGGNIFAPLVPLALLAAIVLLARPGSVLTRALAPASARLPLLRAGLIAWLIMVTIGFLINDSGVAIPAVGALLVAPLLVFILATVSAWTSRPGHGSSAVPGRSAARS